MNKAATLDMTEGKVILIPLAQPLLQAIQPQENFMICVYFRLARYVHLQQHLSVRIMVPEKRNV